MVNLNEVQATNAKRIAEQFLLVRKELHDSVNESGLDKVAATLTAALWSSDEGAKSNGITNGKQRFLTPQ